jgi:hypothetical protein
MKAARPTQSASVDRVELNALPTVNLGLPIKRKVIGVFGDQDLRYGARIRQVQLLHFARCGEKQRALRCVEQTEIAYERARGLRSFQWVAVGGACPILFEKLLSVPLSGSLVHNA